MPLTSYRVESPVFIEPLHYDRSTSKKIAAEDIKSNQLGQPGDGVPNVTSYPYGVYRPNFVQIDEKIYAVTRTSNKRFLTSHSDFLKNGYFSQQDDYEIDGMRAAGEDVRPNMFNIIPKMPDFGLIESPRSPMILTNPRDTQVNLSTSHDIVNAVDPNKLGYFNSKIANLNNDLRNLFFDKANRLNYEAVEWINFLEKKGFSVDTTKNPGILGLGIEKGDFFAAYYPTKGYLISEDKFYNKSKHLISHYGLNEPEAVAAMQRSVLLHEISHVLGVKGDYKGERLQGLLQKEFYSMMANRFKGTKMERIYMALAKEGEDYARGYTLWNRILENILGEERSTTDNLFDDILSKFKREAIELGLQGEDAADYVNLRVAETIGPIIGGEPSYRESRLNNKSKSSKSKNKKTNSKKLEEIVDESSDVSFDAKDGKIIPTYKGKAVGYDGASMPEKLIVDGEKEYKDADKRAAEKEAPKEAEAAESPVGE